jgi:hypothetical protein
MNKRGVFGDPRNAIKNGQIPFFARKGYFTLSQAKVKAEEKGLRPVLIVR